MKRVRFLMVGGFLGAGKTTAIGRLARSYLDRGLKVAIVTNDQAYGLVDTQSLKAQGLNVGEVTGACFCCKFNDLVETAARLSADQQPDVILAEPVGSCTDLAATVAEPLAQLYGDRYDVGPLSVLLKPEHGRKILGGAADVGFSAKAAYIFLKQLEEADIVAINKVDKLSPVEQAELMRLVAERFPGKKVVAISARGGQGMDEFERALDRPAEKRTRTPEVDYDTYAEGEAELGWLNCTVNVRSRDTNIRFSLDAAVLDLVRLIAESCATHHAEPAHLKVFGTSRREQAMANLVSSDAAAELSLASDVEVEQAELTVNARVAIDPEVLAEVVERAAAALGERLSAVVEVTNMQRFRPGRPVPTHRMAIG